MGEFSGNLEFKHIHTQLTRLNSITNRKYYYVSDDPLLMDKRYCLMDQNDDEEVSRHLTLNEMWSYMYGLILFMLNETGKERSWEMQY